MRLLAALIVPLFCVSQALAGEAAPPPQEGGTRTEEQKILYALGTALAGNIAAMELTADELKHVLQGFKDGALHQKLQAEPSVYGPKINEFAASRMKAKAEARKKKEKAFLERAAKEQGAKTLPSGLIYKELKAGSGASPSPADTVRAHYRGTLTNGTQFDSSYDRGQPSDFPLNRVIRCWTEAIPKMKVGGKSRLVCPSDLGYGDGGNTQIPGGAALVFDVELIDIVKQP